MQLQPSIRSLLSLFAMVLSVALIPSRATGAASFVRGDANQDGGADITDPIWILVYLFQSDGQGGISCLESADVNGDGAVDISDAVYELTYLFVGGSPPPPPFPSCGAAPGGPRLGCDRFGPCEGAVGDLWESLNGPPGAGRCLLVQDDTGLHPLYAATQRGTYVSRDKGARWDPIEALEARPVISMAATGGRLFVGTEEGVILACDGGDQVAEILSGGWSGVRVTGGMLAATGGADRPGNLRILLADPSGETFTWQDVSPAAADLSDLQVPPGGAPIVVQDILVDGQTIFASFVVLQEGSGAGTHGGLYVTRNGGRSWRRLSLAAPSGLTVTRIAGSATDLLILLADPVSDTWRPLSDLVWESRDGGLAWNRLTDLTFAVGGLTDIHVRAEGVYLVGPSSPRIVELTKTGHRLIDTPEIPGFEGVPFQLDAILFDPDRPGTVYGQTGRSWELGLVKSEDGMATWRKMDGGIVATSPTIVVAHPEDPRTVFASGNIIQESYVTRDGGATWVPFSPTYSDDEIRIDPHDPDHILLADEMTRLFESRDGGRSFSQVSTAFTSATVLDFEVAPGNARLIYASNVGTGISRLGAEPEWSYMQSSPDYAYDLEIDPEDSAVLYAANSPKIFESDATVMQYSPENGGWKELLRVENAKGITALEIDRNDPDRLYAGVVGERGRIYASEDRGATWRELNPRFTFVTIHALAVDPANEAVVYAAPWGGGLFVSSDHGDTWTKLECPAPSISAIVVDPGNPGRLLVGDRTRPQVHESLDRGRTWKTIVRLDEENFYRLFALALHDGRLYFSAQRRAGGLIALFSDPLSGATFRLDPGGPVEIEGSMRRVALDLDSHSSDLYAVSHIQGIFRLESGRWVDISQRLPSMGFNNLVVLGDGTICAAGGCDLDLGFAQRVADPSVVHQIYRTTDPAAGWTPVLSGDPFASAVKRLVLHPDHPDVWYAATATGLYLSTAAGAAGSWSPQNQGLDFKNIGALAVGREYVYAGTLGGGVYAGRIESDFSVAWRPSTGPYPPIYSIGIKIDPADSSVLYTASYPGGVFKSTDGGATWAERNFGLPTFAVEDPATQGYYSLEIDPGNTDVLYLGIFGRGIYKSTAGGETWRPLYGALGQNRGLMHGSITQIKVDPADSNFLYLASREGFYVSRDAGEIWTPLNEGLETLDLRSLRVGAGSSGTFQDDFEGDTTGTWDLEPGWSVEETAGNHVLRGAGHFWARAGSPSWSDYTFQARIRLVEGTLHTNVRVSDDGRYFLGLNAEGLYLKKQFDGWTKFGDLGGAGGPIDLESWHSLAIEVDGGRITVRLDGALKIDVTDPAPLPAGAIAFETIEESTALVDDIRVETAPGQSRVYAGTAGYSVCALNPASGVWHSLGRTLGLGWWPVWERRMYQFSSILFDPDVPGRIYLGHFPGGFFISEDGGRSWKSSSLGLGNDGIFSLVMHPDDHQVLFAGTYNGVVRSTDGGHTWHARSTGMPPEQWPFTVAIDDDNPQILYTATKNGQNKGFCHRNEFCGVVMKSTDGGEQWTGIMQGLPERSEYYRLLIDPENHQVLFLSTSNGVYWSRDAGASWDPLNGGLPLTRNAVRNNVAENLTFTADHRFLLLGLVGHGVWRADLSRLPVPH